MANVACEEVSRHIAKILVDCALKHATTSAADKPFEPGDLVLVWREKLFNNLVGEWIGPYTVESFNSENRLIYVQDAKLGNARPFNVAQVKRNPDDISHL